MTGRGGNIILIGMPGAARALWRASGQGAGMEFVDTDLLIQRRQGQKLQEILDREGMETFLRVEEETILSLRVRDSVVATGGAWSTPPGPWRPWDRRGRWCTCRCRRRN